MQLKDMRQNYVFCAEIDLGDGNFVRLRELTVGELDGMNKVGEENRVEEMAKLFPACLTAHSFTNEDGSPASNEEVYRALRESASLFVEIVTTWIGSLPFDSRLKKKPK
jgi:hypothetical protein